MLELISVEKKIEQQNIWKKVGYIVPREEKADKMGQLCLDLPHSSKIALKALYVKKCEGYCHFKLVFHDNLRISYEGQFEILDEGMTEYDYKIVIKANINQNEFCVIGTEEEILRSNVIRTRKTTSARTYVDPGTIHGMEWMPITTGDTTASIDAVTGTTTTGSIQLPRSNGSTYASEDVLVASVDDTVDTVGPFDIVGQTQQNPPAPRIGPPPHTRLQELMFPKVPNRRGRRRAA